MFNVFFWLLGVVVLTPFSVSLGLKFYPAFFFSFLVFSILHTLRAPSRPIVDNKNHTKFAFKLSYLNFNFALTTTGPGIFKVLFFFGQGVKLLQRPLRCWGWGKEP